LSAYRVDSYKISVVAIDAVPQRVETEAFGINDSGGEASSVVEGISCVTAKAVSRCHGIALAERIGFGTVGVCCYKISFVAICAFSVCVESEALRVESVPGCTTSCGFVVSGDASDTDSSVHNISLT